MKRHVVKRLSHNMGFLGERLFSSLNLWAFQWMNVGFGIDAHMLVEAGYLVAFSYPIIMNESNECEIIRRE